jgi:hypothetical protein
MALYSTAEIKKKVLDAIREAGGNRTEAAKTLGITRQHLYYLLAKHLSPAEREALPTEIPVCKQCTTAQSDDKPA